jgi:hypothetical protein
MCCSKILVVPRSTVGAGVNPLLDERCKLPFELQEHCWGHVSDLQTLSSTAIAPIYSSTEDSGKNPDTVVKFSKKLKVSCASVGRGQAHVFYCRGFAQLSLRPWSDVNLQQAVD